MADQSALSSRAIIGTYYRLLEMDTGVAWVDKISNIFGSDQSSEEYAFLGMPPALQEWIGGRQIKSLNSNSITLTNVHYEAGIEIRVKDARRDKTGQINARLAELVERQQSHWATLLSALINAGETDNGYDGKTFFATDHVEGANSTSQSNNISVDISAIPAEVTSSDGTTTNPTVGEMQGAINQCVAQMIGFVDDQGEPMNQNANQFLLMVNPGLWPAAVAATSLMNTGAMVQNVNPNTMPGMIVNPVMNTRITATDAIYLFRTDSAIKPLIRQTEMDSQLKSKAEGSEFEFDNDAWQFGIDSWRTTGYGYWQHAVRGELD